MNNGITYYELTYIFIPIYIKIYGRRFLRGYFFGPKTQNYSKGIIVIINYLIRSIQLELIS